MLPLCINEIRRGLGETDGKQQQKQRRNKAGGSPLVLDDAALAEAAETPELSEIDAAIAGGEPKGGHSL